MKAAIKGKTKHFRTILPRLPFHWFSISPSLHPVVYPENTSPVCRDLSTKDIDKKLLEVMLNVIVCQTEKMTP
ncbi:MAG: hypothetical protein ACYCXE_01195 [Thermoleophilia bacterium]